SADAPVLEETGVIAPRFIDKRTILARRNEAFIASARRSRRRQSPVYNQPVAGQPFLDQALKTAVAVRKVFFGARPQAPDVQGGVPALQRVIGPANRSDSLGKRHCPVGELHPQ